MRLFSTTNSTGNVPDRRQVQALIEQTFAQRAVADNARDNSAVLPAFNRQAMTHANGCHAALHSIAMKMPKSDMLAAADTVTNPLPTAP